MRFPEAEARKLAIADVVKLLELEAEKCVDRGDLGSRDLLEIITAKVKALLAPHQPADPQDSSPSE